MATTTVSIELRSIPDTGFEGDQKVLISSDTRTMWEGTTGQKAELKLNGPTTIQIKYCSNLSRFGGKMTSVIDPSITRKYIVKTQPSSLKTLLSLEPVDPVEKEKKDKNETESVLSVSSRDIELKIQKFKRIKIFTYVICILCLLIGILGQSSLPGYVCMGLAMLGLFGLIGSFIGFASRSNSLDRERAENQSCVCCGIKLNKELFGRSLDVTDNGNRMYVCKDCIREGNNSFSINKKSGEVCIQGTADIQAYAKQEAENQREGALLTGYAKFNKMQEMERKRNARIAKISGELGDLMLSGVGQEKETDWAIAGGLASGIAGPAAGLAVAANTVVKNQEIRERNEERIKQGSELKLQSMLSPINNLNGLSEYDFNQKYTVDLTWSPEKLFSFLSIDLDKAEYDFKTKAVRIEARWRRNSSAPCIDGSLRAKIYDEQAKCVGCAYLLFIKTGTEKYTHGSLSGICFLPKRLEKYKTVIELNDLWELAPKGMESKGSDGLTIKERTEIVEKYRTEYENELKT